MKLAAARLALPLLATAATLTVAGRARAIDFEDVGGETLKLDVTNTTELSYHFDNRNDAPVDPTTQTLTPSQYADDKYGEWLNRLHVRLFYWRLSFGLRLDSAVYFHTLSRDDAQQLIVDKLGHPDLELENRFGRELHSRFGSNIYPAKLWLGYSQPGVEATVGDFYAQLGRGLVLSVRSMDELGVDTTIRGGKIVLDKQLGDYKVSATLLGGQLNPMRVDPPTGRILTETGSPLFFGFPRASDFEYYADPTATTPTSDPARPSYLPDSVVGAHLDVGLKVLELGLNAVMLGRQSNSADQLRCRDVEHRPADQCLADYPSFSTPEASRAHDLIRNISGSIRVPPIAGVVDAYVEVAGQQLLQGRAAAVDSAGNVTAREDDLSGYAIYANVNIGAGPIAATLEAKHYRSFFPLGANVDLATPGFSAPEFGVVAYSQPPTTESVYVEPIGAPNVCNTGGRGRLDWRMHPQVLLYGWLGFFRSYSEIDANNNQCRTDDSLRTDTWDMAVGTELNAPEGKSHSWAWIGARLTDRGEPAEVNSEVAGESAVFYREGYIRYDMNQELAGPVSLSAQGFHRRRYEPSAVSKPWNEGENYLALNWNPHFSFIFGYEYQTRPGFPSNYFSGSIQYRSKSNDTVWDQLFDTVRLFVGQRRAAMRCVGGSCRVWPAFEGAKLELVSRF